MCRDEEIKDTLEINTIDEAVRMSRLRWWGHVMRMGEGRLPRTIMNSAIEGKRGRGRPRRRWLDSVSNDFMVRGVEAEEAIALSANRGGWRRLVRTPSLANQTGR